VKIVNLYAGNRRSVTATGNSFRSSRSPPCNRTICC